MVRVAARGVVEGEPGKLPVPKLHCHYCGRPVPKGRRNWCGPACVDEYSIRNNPGIARARVLERDRGICSACGRDTVALQLKVEAWLAADWIVVTLGGRSTIEHQTGPIFALAQRRRGWAARFGIRMLVHWAVTPWPGPDGVPRFTIRTLWEMDHRIPVVEGGGGCGLDGLRTLCRPCHKRATAELAARRALARKAR